MTRDVDLNDESGKTAFSGWVSGLMHSMLGKRTGRKDASSAFGNDLEESQKKTLVADVAGSVLKLLAEKTGEDGFAKTSEIGALRRLQREAFSDLLKFRIRLEKLEHYSELHSKNAANLPGGARTRLRGEVHAGGAFVIVQDSNSNHARSMIQHAGMRTGLDVLFTFATRFRENDLLTTECVAGQSIDIDGKSLGGPIVLQKMHYLAQVNDALTLSVAPVGAKASDISETLNHLQGQALTAFAGRGPVLYQQCKGSAIGAALRSNSVLLSMSQFVSGWANGIKDSCSGPLCLSTLAQFMVQPSEHIVFSLSAVNHLWPSPPLPSSTGIHWSEMGPLILCKSIPETSSQISSNSLLFRNQSLGAPSDHLQDRFSQMDDLNKGTALQAVAFAAEIDLGADISLGGWAQLERGDWLFELEQKEMQWAISLAKSAGKKINWGLSIGSMKGMYWSNGDESSQQQTSSANTDPCGSQVQMEAFITLDCGKGFSLQPGMVYVLDKHSQTPAFMLRSSWAL